MTFENLHLIEPILQALIKEGYEIPTPIQEQAIPLLLAGRDILGSAQTGTGKTAAFAIPILQNLTKEQSLSKTPKVIKSLILTPTRELALQIKDSFIAYGQNLKLKTIVVFGGVKQHPQEMALKAGVDILVATPGRLLDLMDQKLIDLSFVKYFVLDEADRMLDMGFINDVKKVIAKLPTKRQTMLFSATMPDEIAKLAQNILVDPERIAIVPVEKTVDAIDQKLYFVTKKNKTSLLLHILENKDVTSALIFTRTKHGANKLCKDLISAKIDSEAIHGNKSQGARQQALFRFKNHQIRVLVATDIAARGIDIDHLSHVINFDLPDVPETYIHRIGRTGRAGLDGSAITFCAEDELPLLKDIQNHIKKMIPVVSTHPYSAIFLDIPVLGQKSMPMIPIAKPKKVEPKNFSAHDSKNHRGNQPRTRKPEGFNSSKAEARYDTKPETRYVKPAGKPVAKSAPVVEKKYEEKPREKSEPKDHTNREALKASHFENSKKPSASSYNPYGSNSSRDSYDSKNKK